MGKFLRKILGAPNAALRLLAEQGLIRWLRDGRAGKHGPALERTLAALEGKKTLLGVAFGSIGFILLSFGLDHEAVYVFLVAGAFAGAGIADKAVREPGRPAALENSWLYRFLAQNAGTVATVLTMAFGYVLSQECQPFRFVVEVSCTAQYRCLFGIAALLVYVGILDQAFLSKTPNAVRGR